jgi:tRNA U34 5-methylaminomethyl-2-thiouridine-forming methyltransferase MnmC
LKNRNVWKPNKTKMHLQLTNDGSPTLLSEQFGVLYHSKHGAVQETQHVFIEAGLLEKAKTTNEIHILEIGLGTGLNAFMTLLEADKKGLMVHYTSIEAYPVSIEMASELRAVLEQLPLEKTNFFQQIHEVAWEKPIAITPNFTLTKVNAFFENIQYTAQFDVIYFDAFAPEGQPHLWEVELLQKMYNALKINGLFTTYCAKGVVKRALKQAGFQIEGLPGPPGKREMTRGRKAETNL